MNENMIGCMVGTHVSGTIKMNRPAKCEQFGTIPARNPHRMLELILSEAPQSRFKGKTVANGVYLLDVMRNGQYKIAYVDGGHVAIQRCS